MLPLASETPGGPDMLLTASADGTIAGGFSADVLLVCSLVNAGSHPSQSICPAGSCQPESAGPAH